MAIDASSVEENSSIDPEYTIQQMQIAYMQRAQAVDLFQQNRWPNDNMPAILDELDQHLPMNTAHKNLGRTTSEYFVEERDSDGIKPFLP